MKRSRCVLLCCAILALAAAPVGADHHQLPKPTAAELAQGKAVYEKSCALCHASGVAGALKLGDKAAWKSHIAMGTGHLLEVAIKGTGQMPPRGGNPKLTDAELKAAVLYMVEQSK